KRINNKIDSSLNKKTVLEIDTTSSVGILNAVADSLSKASMEKESNGVLNDSSAVKKISEKKVFKDIPDEVKRKLGLPVDSTNAKKDELENIPKPDSTKKLIQDDI
ncbi:MAG: hypothetical protein WC055_13005, partial [Melioribacteraceae bacterium]